MKESFKSFCDDVIAKVREGYWERRAEDWDMAYEDGLEEGLYKTISALYEADVLDDEIIRVMNKIWEIPQSKTEELLVYEKISATSKALRRYFKSNNKSRKDYEAFVDQYDAINRIRNNSDLWELRKQPDKLLDAIKRL